MKTTDRYPALATLAGMLALFSSPVWGDETSDRELAKLRGTWVCSATLQDGKEVRTYVGVKAVIEGDNLTWYFPKKDGTFREQKNKFRIDATKEPKHFDWWLPDKPKSVDLRLYSIDDGVLRMATNLDYATRPTTFDSARWQFTCKRVKASK
jgi:uncharacterized protein (TIGR03067 family)